MAQINATPKVPGSVPSIASGRPSVVTPPAITDDQQERYFGSKLSEQQIEDLTLQNIGGRELSLLARHDNINGIEQSYSPIKNVADIALTYNPVKLAYNANAVTDFLDIFRYGLTRYIPTQEDLDAFYQAQNATSQNITYFDKNTNSLVIHVANATGGELIDVEFVGYDSIKNLTEYS